MRLRYGILCFFAIFIIFFLVLKNYEVWNSSTSLARESARAQTTGPKPEVYQTLPPKIEKDEKGALSTIVAISEKNPFHPDRKDFPIITTENPELKKPLVRPQVTLYGVMIAGEYRTASISYPRPLRKGEREVFTAKIGDKVGEYKISKISEDRIELEAPGDSFEVLLYDGRFPKKRIEAKTVNRPATITSTIATPTAPEPPKPAVPPTVVKAASEKPTIQEKVIEAQAPRPASQALVPLPGGTTPTTPSVRTRRWFGPKPPGEE